MDPSQQQQQGHAQQQQQQGGDEQEEFQFDPEEHQVLTLDEALEIFDDGSVPPSQEDLEREEQEAAQQAMDGDHEEEEAEDLRPDTSVAHFASHDGSIFGLAAHPVEPLLVVSGGEDDLAFLWRVDTGEEVAKLSGHSDSVSCLAFSADGELVSTGGMDGKVRLWRRVKGVAGFEWGKWEFLTSLDGPDEVTTLVWHPRGQVLTAGSTDGTIWMWNLPSGKNMGIFAQHTAPITSLSWISPTEGKRLLSTSDDATVLVWSPTDPTSPQLKFAIHGHDARFTFGMGPEDGGSGVTCSAVNAQGSLALIGGASNGALRILNLSTGGFIASLVEGHAADCAISAVLWMPLGPTPGLWISAGTDGNICAWDVAHGTLRWKVAHPKMSEHPAPAAETLEHGDIQEQQQGGGESSSGMDVEGEGDLAVTAENAISCLVPHPDQVHFSASASNGSTITWEAKSGQMVGEHLGQHQAVHGLAVACNGQAVASVGDDGLGRVHLLQHGSHP